MASQQTTLSARLDTLQRANQAELIDNEEYRFLRKQAFIHLAVRSDVLSSPGANSAAGRSPAKRGSSTSQVGAISGKTSVKRDHPTGNSFLDVPKHPAGHPGRDTQVDQNGRLDVVDRDAKKDRRRSLTQWIGGLGSSPSIGTQVDRTTGVEGERGDRPAMGRRTSWVIGHRDRSRSPSPGPGSPVKDSGSVRERGRGSEDDSSKERNGGNLETPDRRRSWISPSIATSSSIPPIHKLRLLQGSPNPSPTKRSNSDLGLSPRPPSSFRTKSIPTLHPSSTSSSSPSKVRTALARPPVPMTLDSVQSCVSIPILRAESARLAVEEWELRRAYEEVEEGIWKGINGDVRTAAAAGPQGGSNMQPNAADEHKLRRNGGADRPVLVKRGLLERTRSRMFNVFQRAPDAGSVPSSTGFAKLGGKRIADGSEVDGTPFQSGEKGPDGSLRGLGLYGTSFDGRLQADKDSSPPPGAMPSTPPSQGGVIPSRPSQSRMMSPTPSFQTVRPPSTTHPTSVLSAGTLSILQTVLDKEHETLEQKMDKLEKLKGFKEDSGRRYEERRGWVEARIRTVELKQRATAL